MGFCRQIRSYLLRSVSSATGLVTACKDPTIKAPITIRQSNHLPTRRKAYPIRLSLLLSAAFCFLLSASLITIWIQTAALLNQCSIGCRPDPRLMDKRLHESATSSSRLLIDVALVVGGSDASRQVPTLVKSIFYQHLFGRKCSQSSPSLRLHLICSPDACKGLQILFDTWRIGGLSQVHFYQAEKYMSRINWIPNTHYSGGYGLLKLVVADILPKTIKRVIILDLDILVLEGDITYLWNSAEAFNDDEIIGLVENQSEWYITDRGEYSWPALGRGYNTGVAVIDVQKMRKLGWGQHWKAVAETLLKNRSHTALADQDIVNAALYFSSKRVHRLPCSWNLQLVANANYSNCLSNDRICGERFNNLTILHWNLRSKSLLSKNDGDAVNFDQLDCCRSAELCFNAARLRTKFALMFYHLSSLDGNLLREVLSSAFSLQPNLGDNNDQLTEVKGCSFLSVEMRLRRRILPFFFGNSQNVTGNVTLVSQLSFDRLHRLEEIAAHWEGPMSLVIYITDRETSTLTEYLDSSTFLTTRDNICIHLVFQEGSFYPINALRNVAIEYATTTHVFIMDFDFVPNIGLHRFFQQFITSGQETAKAAYIVPAFETSYTQLEFPSNKEQLMLAVASGLVKPFRKDVWEAGHLATNYSHWSETDTVYEVKWDADFEPYVLIRRGYARFDEHFVGFGWNKVSFFMLLDSLDFKFAVLPDAFIIHLPHAPSMESHRFRNSPAIRQCLEEFKLRYIKDLASQFGVKSLKYLRFRQRSVKL